MNTTDPRPSGPFNPPIRIISQAAPDAAKDASASERFGRPKLQRSVARERVAGYFSKRRFPRGSPLD